MNREPPVEEAKWDKQSEEEAELEAFSRKLELAKVESSKIWEKILEKIEGGKDQKRRGRIHGSENNTRPSDDEPDIRARTRSFSWGAGGDATEHVTTVEEDDEDEESATLPTVSVSGYPTPGYLLHPNQPLKVVWDLFVGLLIVYSVVSVPFRIAYRLEDSPGLFWSDAFFDLCFGFDVVVTFRTAYEDEENGGYETNPWLIAEKYARSWLTIDVLSTVPFEMVASVVSSGEGGGSALLRSTKLLKILRLARLLKLMRLVKLGGKAKSRPEDDPGFHPTIKAFIKMLVMLYFIAHLLACLWYAILDEGSSVNWLNRFGGSPDTVASMGLWPKYLASLYWAFTTMTTVGYGDIAGTNKTEWLVVIAGMLVGASVFGYVIGNVTAMMETFDPQGAMYQEKIDRVKEFIMDRSLPPGLARRIKYHFKHCYHRTTVFDETSAELLASLPPPAAAALVFANHRPLLHRLSFLRHAPPLFTTSLIPCLKPCLVHLGEYVARDGDLGLGLVLVEKGKVRRFLEITPKDEKEDRAVQAAVVASFRLAATAEQSLAQCLGFEAEHRQGRSPRGCLVVKSVDHGGQANAAGVEPGMWIAQVDGNQVRSVSEYLTCLTIAEGNFKGNFEGNFKGAVREKRKSGCCRVVLEFRRPESKPRYVDFDELGADRLFGEASVLLNTPHLCSSVAATQSELWIAEKDDLLFAMEAYPEVRAGLVQSGMEFLEDVRETWAMYGQDGCPESIHEMMPDAQEEDIHPELGAFSLGSTPPWLKPEHLAASMISDPGSDPLAQIGAGKEGKGRAIRVQQRASGFRAFFSLPRLDPNKAATNPTLKTPVAPRRPPSLDSLDSPLESSQDDSLDLDGPGFLSPPPGNKQRLAHTSPEAADSASERAVLFASPSGNTSGKLSPIGEGKESEAPSPYSQAGQAEEQAEEGPPSPKYQSLQVESGRAVSGDPASPDANSADDQDGTRSSGSGDLDGSMAPYALLKATGLFHPEAATKMVWDVLLSLIILYSVLTVTYQIGFGADFGGALGVVDFFVDLFFALDILVTFNTAVVDVNGNLISDRWFIATGYLKSWFAIDFISTAPLELIVGSMLGGSSDTKALSSFKLVRAVRLVRLVKILRIIKMSGFFDKMEESLGLHPAVLKTLKLFLIMGFAAHLFACILYATADCQSGEQGCWVENYCLGGDSWFDDDGAPQALKPAECLKEMALERRYVASVYWAFATMTTIGYGDMTPSSHSAQETGITIMVEILGTTIFAYVVGCLVSIITNLSMGPKIRKQNLLYLNHYLRDFTCTLPFRRSLRLHYLFRQRIRSVFDETSLLNQMPPDLRVIVFEYINGKYREAIPLLSLLEAQTRGAFALIMPRLRPFCFSKGDAVFHPMLGVSREIFFIEQGRIDVRTFRSDKASLETLETSPKRTATKRMTSGDLDAKGFSESKFESTDESADFEGGYRLHNEDVASRHGRGDFLGEVPLLIPDSVQFELKVEVRAAEPQTQVFSLSRQDYCALQGTFPQITKQLDILLQGAFEANFQQWVQITSKDFDYESMIRQDLCFEPTWARVAERRRQFSSGMFGSLDSLEEENSQENASQFTASGLPPASPRESAVEDPVFGATLNRTPIP